MDEVNTAVANAIAGLNIPSLPIAESDVINLTGDLAAKLDASVAGAFGLTLLTTSTANSAKSALGLGSVDNTADNTKNVLSATKLTTARNINGVAFDGTGNITINAVDLTARVPITRNINTTAPLTGGGSLAGDLTLTISAADQTHAGSMSAADKIKLDATLNAVKYTSTGVALGSSIADYFTSTLSLDANSIYEIECHAYFLKTTAGTVTWTWVFSSAPIMVTSRNQSTPITGFTSSIITGAEIFAEATQEGSATVAHAASGSLTTAVRHSFLFRVRVVTNLATTIQLRCTESAGTVTPQAGSYIRARKII